MTSETMIKSAGTIEQKGVAQLLQIEEVRLKSSRRCGFSNHHMHKKLAYSLKHTLLGRPVARGARWVRAHLPF